VRCGGPYVSTMGQLMNTLSIFAGLDNDDVLHFVGDVPRGAACGCRCAACGAPLVAKRGEEKVWHFAHEASQERPDCLAGAVNLLRRLAIEQLRDAPFLTLPTFRRVVSTKVPLPILRETIELDAQPIAVDHWNSAPAHGAPAAILILPDGSHARMFVEVRARHAVTLALQPGMAAVLIEIPLPMDGSVLQNLAAAKTYLENSRQIFWAQHPSGDALAVSTLRQLNQRAQSLEHERTVLGNWRRHEDFGKKVDTLVYQHEPVATAQIEADNPDWIAWRKPKSSFIFYAGREGNGWLLLQHREGGQVLVPWPVAIEGWDEALPQRIGVPDHELGGYRVAHEVNAMVYLGSISEAGIRNFSAWSELPRRPKE